MGITGDFDELRRLRRNVGDASRSVLKERILRAAAAEARTQVALEFRSGVDPYGNPWAPLKSRDGQILRKTGRLANSFTAEPTARGFKVGTNVEYAQFHQQGTKGHRAHQRFQPVGSGGKFVTRNSRSKAKGKQSSVRHLNFKQGGGVLPRRMMIPEGELSSRWRTAIDAAMRSAADNFFAGK